MLLATGTMLIALQLVGIPGEWAAGILSAVEDRGVYLDAERVSLDVRRGVVVHGCRVFDEPSRRVPLLRADSVGFRLDRWSWIRGSFEIREVTVEGGHLRLGSTSPARTAPALELDAFEGRLMLDEDDLVLERLSLRCLGIQVRGQGRVDMRWVGPSAGDGVGMKEISSVLREGSTRLQGLFDQLEQVHFATPATVDVEFVLRPGLPAGSLVRLRGGGGHTMVRGLAFDGWGIEGSLRGDRLEFEHLFARAGDDRVVGSGSYHLATKLTEAHLDSNLSPIYLEGLMPIGWRDRLDETGLFFLGPMRLEASLGPEVPERLMDSFAGRVRIVQAELRKVWVDRADLRFRLQGRRLVVPSFDMVIGKDKMQGPARGSFSLDLDTRAVEGTLRSEFDWAEMLPVISGGPARAIRLMQFAQGPPVTDVRFAGRPGSDKGFFLEGTLTGKDFLYRGTHVNECHTGIVLTNHVLTLAPLRADRDEGFVEGSVAIDFRQERVDLDLYSTADPPAAARTGGEKVSRIVNRFRFEGAAKADMHGSVFYGSPPQGTTEIHATAWGEQLGLKWFTADEAWFDFHLLGKEALVTNFAFRAYGGEGEGVVRVFPAGPRWGFSADLDVKGAGFGEVVKWSMHREGPLHPGLIDLSGSFGGLLGEDFMHSLAGTGSASVAEAQLLQIPLFFGLSRGLSRIFPGLGFATQDEFNASFLIEDQRVYTDDGKLEGAMLGLAANGSYGLVDQDLDFEVEVRLLREQGMASSLLHLVTSPLSKLLQFELSGTLEQPSWRPDNLPKELFLMFD